MNESLYMLAQDIMIGMAEKAAPKSGKSVATCLQSLIIEFESNADFAAAICMKAIEYKAQIKAAVSS